MMAQVQRNHFLMRCFSLCMPIVFCMITAWFGAFVQGTLEKSVKAPPLQKAARNQSVDVRHGVENDTRLQLGAWIQQFGLEHLGVEKWNEYRRRLVEDDDDLGLVERRERAVDVGELRG